MIAAEKNDTFYVPSEIVNALVDQLCAAVKAPEIARLCACKKQNG